MTSIGTGSPPGTPCVADAFGQLLLAAQARAGQPAVAYEVTERDDGHVSVRDAHHYFTALAPGTPDADLLASVSGRVLDVGCGAGRHLALLQQRGVTAVGLDSSLGAVQVCALRGFDAAHGDVREPQPPIGTFDVLLLLGGNLGLLGSPQQAPDVLRALAALANPGARLLAEGINTAATDDPVHRAYRAANIARGRHPGQITMRVRWRDQATAWTDRWYPDTAELVAITQDTGWQLHTVAPLPGGHGYHAELIQSRT